MSPKFRYDPDDESDFRSPKSTSRARAKREGLRWKSRGPSQTIWLDPSEGNATVAEVLPKQCIVWMDEGGGTLLCNYRRAKVLRQNEEGPRERSPVAVGDRVKVAAVGKQDGIVEGVCARTNQIARPAPAQEQSVVHVIAANVDLLVIVAATEEPNFSPGLVDRYLVAAQHAGVPALICVNKIDLAEGGTGRLPENPPWGLYTNLGYSVAVVSAKREDGIAELREKLSGRCAVFCGHSGVGKTSLLRALIGSEVGRVGAVNAFTKKGRHTTTGALLLGGPRGSRWIDTPGIRGFGLVGVEPDALKGFFPEFQGLECAVEGCLHLGEEGCAATHQPRIESYRRIHQSLLELLEES